MSATEQLFIRHAESETNAHLPACLDIGDPDLTTRGERQATELDYFLSQQALDVLVCSPKLRATRTSDLASRSLGVPIYEDTRLAEFEWGEARGLPMKIVFNACTEARARRQGNKFRLAPGAETPQEAYDRVDDLTREYKGLAVAYFTHGWLARTYFGVRQGLSREDIRRKKIANAEVLSDTPGSFLLPKTVYLPSL